MNWRRLPRAVDNAARKRDKPDLENAAAAAGVFYLSLLIISALTISLPNAFAQQNVNVGNTLSSTVPSLSSAKAPVQVAMAPKKRSNNTSRSRQTPLASRGRYNRAQASALPSLSRRHLRPGRGCQRGSGDNASRVRS
jgi:hypothetical protein